MILSIKRDTKDHRREVQKVWRARTGESKCLHSSHLARPVWPVFSSSLFATESESFDFELLHTRSLGLSRNLPRRFHDNPIERLRWRLTYPANEKKTIDKTVKELFKYCSFRCVWNFHVVPYFLSRKVMQGLFSVLETELHSYIHFADRLDNL